MAEPQLLPALFSAQIVEKRKADSANISRIHLTLAMIYGTRHFKHDKFRMMLPRRQRWQFDVDYGTEALTVEEMMNVQWCPSCMKRIPGIDSFLERIVLKFEEVEVFKSRAEREKTKILESILSVKKTDFNDFVGIFRIFLTQWPPSLSCPCRFEKHFIVL